MPDVISSSIIPLSTLGPDEVANRIFPTARRGFDQTAVRQFLSEVGASLREFRRTEQDLRTLLLEAEHRAQAPELDDDALSAAVGAETAKVLQAAHEAARGVLANAEARAQRLVADAEATVAERSRSASAEATMVIERARADAEAAIEAAKYQSQMMIDEAREARRKILSDLAVRRRALHVQLEQLRAGRDALAGIVGVVASSVDAVRVRLDQAEQEARSAADDAGRAHQQSVVEAPIEEVIAEALSKLVPNLDSITTEGESSTNDVTPVVPAVHGDLEEKGDELDELQRPSVDAAATVDELFAKIRAEREQVRSEEEFATAPPTEPNDAINDAINGRENETSATAVESVVAGLTPTDDEFSAIATGRARTADPISTMEPFAPSVTIIEAEPTRNPVPRRFEPRKAASVELADHLSGKDEAIEELSTEEQLISQRDALLRPSASELGRVLKRLLRIEQNDLLDMIRHVSPSADPLGSFPYDAVAQRTVEAASPVLREAWTAGELFAQELSGQESKEHRENKEMARGVQEVADELSSELIGALRRHLARASDSLQQSDLGEYVNAGFRDLKGTRIEGVAGDYAMRAFSRGSLNRASAINLPLRWVVDDDGASCPDCDDNALAGPQQAGGMFPTGHAYSPVHPGCRCMLVPAP